MSRHREPEGPARFADRIRLEILMSNGSRRTIKTEYEYLSYGRQVDAAVVERFVKSQRFEVSKEAKRYGLTIEQVDVHIDTRRTQVTRETETTVKTELKKQLFTEGVKP